MKGGDRGEAADEFREAIRLEPDEADHHVQLGYTLEIMMMFDEAIAEYRVAERLQPNSDKTAIRHLSIARILDRPGKLDEAIAEDRIAVRLNPELKDAKNNLAWKLTKKRVLSADERSELLKRALEAVDLAPRDANVWNTLALAEYRAGHWSESIAAAERSIALYQGLESFDWFAASENSIARLYDTDASNWFFLAMAHWRRGEKERARSYFAKAVAWTKRKDPTDVELLQFWGESAELLGEQGPGVASPTNSSSRVTRP